MQPANTVEGDGVGAGAGRVVAIHGAREAVAAQTGADAIHIRIGHIVDELAEEQRQGLFGIDVGALLRFGFAGDAGGGGLIVGVQHEGDADDSEQRQERKHHQEDDAASFVGSIESHDCSPWGRTVCAAPMAILTVRNRSHYIACTIVTCRV